MIEDGSILNELLIKRLNYLIYVVLLLIGLHAMIAKRNLIKKLIGMAIFQTAIILFYVSIAVKEEATVPIYKAEHDPHGEHAKTKETAADYGDKYQPVALSDEEVRGYANPLPHVLMLTAIVVGVATLGLALALCQRIFQGYGTIEEDELLTKLERADARASLSPLGKTSRGISSPEEKKRVRKLSKSKELAKEAPRTRSQSVKRKTSLQSGNRKNENTEIGNPPASKPDKTRKKIVSKSTQTGKKDRGGERKET